jgi:ADP-ribose pyrophosphatase YjhB (NUDIX family)
MKPKWLEWAQQIQSISQAGIEYSKDPYDIERFENLREISVEIVAAYTEYNMETVRSLFANETGYQTPKLDVRAVVPKNGALLFVHESSNDLWALPGGWAEPDYSLLENAKKEVEEEAGMIVTPTTIIAVLDRSRHVSKPYPYTVYKSFVLCEYGEGTYKENIETLAAEFFEEDNLPPLSVGRNTPEMVKMCFDYIKGRNTTMTFD